MQVGVHEDAKSARLRRPCVEARSAYIQDNAKFKEPQANAMFWTAEYGETTMRNGANGALGRLGPALFLSLASGETPFGPGGNSERGDHD